MSSSSASELESVLGEQVLKSLGGVYSQLKPFLPGATTTDLATIIKPANFDQQWAVVLDERGSYLDESGCRIAVRKRLDDGSVSTTNDVDWAAYNEAKFWSMTAIAMADANVGERPSIIWRYTMQAMRRTCKEEIYKLAIKELGQMKIRPDTRTLISSVPADAYPYPALLPDASAIRLVVLLPALEAHEDIVCRLCNSTLDKSKINQYEALSYVWGNSSKRKSIIVENRIFQATENLEAALRNLRGRDKPRVLWIDAICINQNDVMERNAQVRQMDRIYKESQRVVVWLGPEFEDSSDAINFIRCLPMLEQTFAHTEYRKRYLKMFARSLAAVGQLLGRPWFTRIWCIQEFVLGPHATFQCGQDEIPWEDFIPLIQVLRNLCIDQTTFDDLRHHSNNGIDMLCWSRVLPLSILFRWKLGQQTFSTVLALLSDFRAWQSSDPRDFIFALYGLVPDGDENKDILQPDYGLSVSELYTQVAHRLLQAEKNPHLAILSIATMPSDHSTMQNSRSWLPSWVPDWRLSQPFGTETRYHPIAYKGIGNIIQSLDANFDACLHLEATPISLEDDEQVLCLNGITADTIEAVGYAYPDTQQNMKGAIFCQIVSQWIETAQLSAEARYPYTGQPVWEAFCRTLIFDSEVELERGFSRSRIPSQDSELGLSRENSPSAEEIANYLDSLTTQIVGRRFFRTSRGMFGLGGAAARVGDRVVVLYGGKAPFIIRGSEYHHLISECYVHGIMDGEIIHQPRTEAFQHLQEETFRLG